MEDNREAIKLGYSFQTEGGEKALVYNQLCLKLGHNQESGEYQDLVDEIAGQIRSQEDVQKGTQWSTIYILNGVTLVLIGSNSVLMIFGARYFYPRLLALIFNLFLTLLHFCAIVTTGVFRFRALGKLCALSKQPTKESDLDWTYQSDATLIDVLWSFQIILLAPFCIAGAIPMLRFKRKSEVMDETQLVNITEKSQQLEKEEL